MMEPLPAALAVVPVPGFVLVCAGFQPVLQSPDPAISESGIFQLTLGVKWCSDLALLSCAYRCYRFEPQYIFYFPDGLLCGNVVRVNGWVHRWAGSMGPRLWGTLESLLPVAGVTYAKPVAA